MAQKFHIPTQLNISMTLDAKLRWKEHIVTYTGCVVV
jgi:hypothetical protein